MVGAALATPPEITIKQEPQHLTVNTPAAFSLHFENRLLNEAAARREWTYTWTFGDDPETESGWRVSRVFEQPATITARAEIKDLTGNLLATLSKPVSVQAVAVSRSLSKETHLEGMRLLIVLFLARFGLMAAAQQKAQGLTFWEAVTAVVAIGFGAGTIKDIIVRAEKTWETTPSNAAHLRSPAPSMPLVIMGGI
jgi:hypothetical protein